MNPLWQELDELKNSIEPDNDEQFGVLEQALQDVKELQQRNAIAAEWLMNIVDAVDDEIGEVIEVLEHINPDDDWQQEIVKAVAQLSAIRGKLF